MKNHSRSRRARGTTLIELMVAMVIAAIGALGFVATANAAGNNSAVSYRRTNLGMLRTSLIQRSAMIPRTNLSVVPGGWMLYSCLDIDAQTLVTNSTFAAGFICPGGTVYDSWVQVVPNLPPFANNFIVHTYAERTDAPCNPATRYTSKYCIAGDTVVTN